MSQVHQASDSIDTGSAEIATGNADLSLRTKQQAFQPATDWPHP
ncbi:hypothetical protein [Aquabacterium sp.]